MKDFAAGVAAIVVALAMVVGLIVGGIWVFNSIRVWTAETGGKAKLAEARYSKQVKFEEAKANLESQKLNAKAEVERAKGAAQAIKLERGTFTNEDYIKYLYVRDMDKLDTKFIYVPTEAGIPILDAGRATK